KEYKRAIKNADLAIAQDKKNLKSYHVKVMSLHNLGIDNEALEISNIAIGVKKNFSTYFDKAEILFSLKQYSESQKFYAFAIDEDINFATGYVGAANSYYYQNQFDKAINSANTALVHDSKSKDALWIRSKAYRKKMDYMSSINDLSQIILLYPNEDYIKDVYYERGLSYTAFNQHVSAVIDYTKVIELKPNYYQAYFKRAEAYVAMRNLDNAIADYERLEELDLKDEAAVAMLATARVKLFELKREDDKPQIIISDPFLNVDNKIQIIEGTEIQKFAGQVNDISPIKYLKINGVDIQFDSTSKKNEFFIDLNVTGKTEIEFVCSDVYDNVRTIKYPILYTEIGLPEIQLIQPMVSSDGQIYLEEEGLLFVQGSVFDKSLIASISIDGVTASYRPSELNPTFNANIEVKNKSEISINVEDIYGNISTKKLLINRGGASSDNPMGKTWVVFIENSNYKTFASLEGPGKDITIMKAALSKYNINAIIHKKDLTKNQMDKFFSITLRDQVINNNVNSIIVWYAGHGKFLNSTGYWVPVDGETDDEFTFFNIQALKSAMKSYSKVITHTLVITDACESGPSFYQAMRGDDDEVRSCGDWKATKFKSSQVFSSAGLELASDNSQFTKTFANSLVHNPDNCIPIGSIVKQVKSAVKRNKQQEPQFGKIDGLPDENGTFFFIRK
ncbi:MAG: tetratricopeptide repeat protein, partial [Bacteroidales bacterium]|nr:tetratricopeptide repeat protein [Bacteroidales bacterium]